MQIVYNKDLIWYTQQYDVIMVGTSYYNLLTQGFQSKMRVKYPQIEDANNSTPYADKRKLGKRITIDGMPQITLMYICGYQNSKRVFLDYEALQQCLISANEEFKGKHVACPILGSSQFDGNGDKERCLDIIKSNTPDLDLTIYDFQQYERRKEIAMELSKWNKYKYKNGSRKYFALLKHKDEYIANLYLKH